MYVYVIGGYCVCILWLMYFCGYVRLTVSLGLYSCPCWVWVRMYVFMYVYYWVLLCRNRELLWGGSVWCVAQPTLLHFSSFTAAWLLAEDPPLIFMFSLPCCCSESVSLIVVNLIPLHRFGGSWVEASIGWLALTVTVFWMTGCLVIWGVQGRLASLLWLADSLLGMFIDLVADRLSLSPLIMAGWLSLWLIGWFWG